MSAAFPTARARQHIRDRDGAVRTLAVEAHDRVHKATLAWMNMPVGQLKGFK